MLDIIFSILYIVNDVIFSVYGYIDIVLDDYGLYDLPMPIQEAVWFFNIAIIVGLVFIFFYVIYVVIRSIFRLFWG